MINPQQLKYDGFVPPCGIFCGGCPGYTKEKNPCLGAGVGCKSRKCKGIYVCCIEKRGLEFCYQCKNFPCSRYKRFAQTWLKYGQDLVENQRAIEKYGKQEFIKRMNGNVLKK